MFCDIVNVNLIYFSYRCCLQDQVFVFSVTSSSTCVRISDAGQCDISKST